MYFVNSAVELWLSLVAAAPRCIAELHSAGSDEPHYLELTVKIGRLAPVFIFLMPVKGNPRTALAQP